MPNETIPTTVSFNTGTEPNRTSDQNVVEIRREREGAITDNDYNNIRSPESSIAQSSVISDITNYNELAIGGENITRQRQEHGNRPQNILQGLIEVVRLGVSGLRRAVSPNNRSAAIHPEFNAIEENNQIGYEDAGHFVNRVFEENPYHTNHIGR